MRYCLSLWVVILLSGFAQSALGAPAEEVPARSYQTANGLLNRELYDLAAAEYRTFLEHCPDSAKRPMARYGLAVCLFRTSQYEATAAQLEPLVTEGGFEFAAEVGTMLGRCQLELGKPDRAAEAFEQVFTQHGDHQLADDAVAGAVEALYLSGRHEESAARARLLTSRWPDSPWRNRAVYYQALTEIAAQQHADAVNHLRQLLLAESTGELAEHARLLLAQCLERAQEFAAAERAYRNVVASTTSPHRPHATVGLARVLHRRNKVDEAEKLLDQLLEQEVEPELAGEAFYLRGRLHFDAGQYDLAQAAFTAAAPNAAERADEVAYWSAKCLLRRNQPGEAAVGLDALVNEHPGSMLLAEACYDRAIALLKADQVNKAESAFTEFRDRFPEHELAAEAMRLSAILSHRRGDYAQSQAHCQAFADQYDDHARVCEIRFLLGENDYLADRLTAATKRYAEYLESCPEDTQVQIAQFRMGMAAHQQGRFDESVSRLSKLQLNRDSAEQFAPALLALGDAQFQLGKWPEAEHWLGQYLAREPETASSGDALLKLGLSQQRQGKLDQALQTYERLLGSSHAGGHRLQTLFEKGQALVALERIAPAVAAFEQVLTQDRDSEYAAYAHYRLGAMAFGAADYTAAAEHYQHAAQKLPDADLRTEAWFQRCQSLVAGERYDEAHSALKEFLKRFPSHDRATAAQAHLALTLARQDQPAKALAAIAQLDARAVEDLDATSWSNLQYEKAWALRAQGKVEPAARAYRDLLARKDAPVRLVAHATLELAELLADEKNFDEAASLLRRLREQNPAADLLAPDNQERLLYRLAICEFERAQFKTAAELLEEFVSAYPGSELLPSASLYCGEAWVQHNRHSRAVDHFARITEHYPDHSTCESAMLRLGESLAILQRWSRSEQVLSDYLRSFADRDLWYQAQFGVGWARENQERYAEALAAYRPVVERHQGSTAARAQFQIGECLFAQKRYDEAVRELLKVDILYAYPEWSAAALYEAGRCFEEQNKAAEARRQFEAVTERHADTQWGELATRRLASLQADALPGR
ncbi:MAG: tetratricopeptide repeat protein [bacterium]|nr:tetratricopeptide repeat protein [bacterium]